MKKEHLLTASAGLLLVGGIGLLHASTFFAGVETQIDQEKGTVVTVERKSDATFLIVLVGLLQIGFSLKIVVSLMKPVAEMAGDVLTENEALVPLNLPAKVVAREAVPDFVTVAAPVAPAPVAVVQPLPVEEVEEKFEDETQEELEINLIDEYLDDSLPAKIVAGKEPLALIGLAGSGKTTLIMSMLEALPEAKIFLSHWNDCAYMGIPQNILKLGQSLLPALLEQVQAVHGYLGQDVAPDAPVWLILDDWSQTVALAEGLLTSGMEGAKDTWRSILSMLQEIAVRGGDLNVHLLFASRLPDVKLPRNLFNIYVIGHTAEKGTLATQAALKNQHLIKDRESANDLMTELEVIESLTDEMHLILSVSDESLRLLSDLSQNWTRTVENSSRVQSKDTTNLVQLHSKPTISRFWYDKVCEDMTSGMSFSEIIKHTLKMGGPNYQEGKKFLETLLSTFESQEGAN